MVGPEHGCTADLQCAVSYLNSTQNYASIVSGLSFIHSVLVAEIQNNVERVWWISNISKVVSLNYTAEESITNVYFCIFFYY